MLTVEERDCELHPPAADSFDVICVAHFLHRPLCAHLAAALRPGGLLFYQTFTAKKLGPGGPSREAFLLREGELLTLFGGLLPRYYREDAACGDTARGERDRALLVAQRPARA